MEARFSTHRLSDILEDWELCFVTERAKKFEAADGEILTMEVKEEEGIALRGLKRRQDLLFPIPSRRARRQPRTSSGT